MRLSVKSMEAAVSSVLAAVGASGACSINATSRAADYHVPVSAPSTVAPERKVCSGPL